MKNASVSIAAVMATPKPTQLHQLHRFFRHDQGRATGCEWNIAAGALEKQQRLYRILYRSATVHIEDELTINVGRPGPLKDFFLLLARVIGHTDLDGGFRDACLDLLTEDPWLAPYWLKGMRADGI